MKLKIQIVLLLVAVQFAFAQNGFDNANELYRKGDFKAAAEAYEGILKTKKESAELYFNLGNAYYKLNQVAPAIYNYEKALLLDPNDKEISNNLKFAQKMQIDDIREVPKVGFGKMINDFTSAYRYDTWAWIAVASAFVFFMLFLGYYFTAIAVYKRIYFGGLFLVLLVIVLSVSAAIWERNSYRNERPAIVFTSVTGVKSEPSVDAADAFVLHEGTKVSVLESLDKWKKIAIPDGNQGWISADAIKELK